jgi:hypothetical protein
MKYKATFKYNVGWDEGERKNTVPIYAFQVDGGANRNIRLKSTNDISITSELEQARSFKNIRLYLSPTSDHKDMQAALDLTAAATKKLSLVMILDIQKYSGGKFIEGLWLIDSQSSIKTEPYKTPGNYLCVEIDLPSVMLLHGKNSVSAKEF